MNLTLGPTAVAHAPRTDGARVPACGPAVAPEKYEETDRDVSCSKCLKILARQVGADAPEVLPEYDETTRMLLDALSPEVLAAEADGNLTVPVTGDDLPKVSGRRAIKNPPLLPTPRRNGAQLGAAVEPVDYSGADDVRALKPGIIDWARANVNRQVMNGAQLGAALAAAVAAFPKGTRVHGVDAHGYARTGTVNGLDAGSVRDPGHHNHGRIHLGVDWDPMPGASGRGRAFVDQLTRI